MSQQRAHHNGNSHHKNRRPVPHATMQVLDHPAHYVTPTATDIPATTIKKQMPAIAHHHPPQLTYAQAVSPQKPMQAPTPPHLAIAIPETATAPPPTTTSTHNTPSQHTQLTTNKPDRQAKHNALKYARAKRRQASAQKKQALDCWQTHHSPLSYHTAVNLIRSC